MTTAEMIKELCEQMNISVSELARRIGQTPQNFSKKLKRGTVTLDELKAIADVLGVKFEQAFILPDGNEIKTGNEEAVSMFIDVEQKLKKKNRILFSRDSECLQELRRLIEQQKHRTLVMWALECAKAPLSQFEEKYLHELRPRKALDLCEDWARGKIKMPVAKRAILDAHTVAKEIDDDVYGTMCHAIGHAGATVHVETHALGLPFYELTSIVFAYRDGDYQTKVQEKIDYYYGRLLYWQENIDNVDLEWASFLMDDNRPNKEKLLNNKRKDNL